MRGQVSRDDVTAALDQQVGAVVPGLLYLVVSAGGTLFEYAGGWADVRGRRAMTADTTLMAYSMTKTFTAVAVLQLAEQGHLALDDRLDHYLPDTPYAGAPITLRHLLTHTSGLPNPIPLRWAHLAEEEAHFDEQAALARVLRENPALDHPPGRRFAYSNLGYWLLGRVIERVAARSYADQVQSRILTPLGLAAHEMAFLIPNLARHANGYLARFSLMNLLKGFLLERKFFGGPEGSWLRLEHHVLHGPAFGGLIGTARGFGRFLRDQLRDESVLFSSDTKRLFETQQKNGAGEPIPMTLGWHLREVHGVRCFFKEGGGGGFHCEMRLYPTAGIGTVVMVNGTEFRSSKLLDRVDRAFFNQASTVAMRVSWSSPLAR